MRIASWSRVIGSCVIILQSVSAAAQPEGPEPVRALGLASLDGGLRALEFVPVVGVPRIDAAALAADALEDRDFGPLIVASVFRTNVAVFSDGWGVVEESQATDDDQLLTWRLRIAAAGARSVGLGFTRYHMPPGGRLFVFTPDYAEVLGPFTDADNADHGELWVVPLPGTEIVVEVSVPADALADLQVEIGAVERGFLDGPQRKPWTSCQTDVVCRDPDVRRYADAVRSVALVRIKFPNDTVGLCTGALINNTRGDRKAYFLTAYHCGGPGDNYDRSKFWTQTVTASIRVYWNHHSPTCEARTGYSESVLLRTRNQSGARLVAAYSGTDFALLELSHQPTPTSTYRQHFAGWSRDPTRYNVIAGIHHPSGTAKTIAWDQRGPYGTDVFPIWSKNPKTERYEWRSNYEWCNSGARCDGLLVYWDKGATTRGSSGSPLFNGRQRILGQLWGGGRHWMRR